MGLLYTRMKIFHFKDKLDSLPNGVNSLLPPLNIRLKPTNACNHNCRYCAYRADLLQLGQDMVIGDSIPRDKMREIIDDLADLQVKAVILSGGGEPFCYPHLLEMVELLTARRIKFAALTNGALLNGAVARHFSAHATWLRISMDGWDDASYTAYRGCPDGEFTRIMANMAAFKKLGGPCYLGVSIVVDEQNCRQVYDMISSLQALGADSVKISPCIFSNSGAVNNDYHQPLLPIVKEQIHKAKADFHRPGFEIFDSYHTQLESFAKAYHWCPHIQINPVIGADLNVYSCRDKAYNLEDGLLGSIKERGFKEFWFSNRNRFFSIDPTVACNHHCVVDSSNAQIHEYLAADIEHLDFV